VELGCESLEGGSGLLSVSPAVSELLEGLQGVGALLDNLAHLAVVRVVSEGRDGGLFDLADELGGDRRGRSAASRVLLSRDRDSALGPLSELEKARAFEPVARLAGGRRDELAEGPKRASREAIEEIERERQAPRVGGEVERGQEMSSRVAGEAVPGGW